MHTKEELYANKIFFNAALPLIKVLAQDVESIKKQYKNVHAVIQVSALDPEAEGGKTDEIDRQLEQMKKKLK